MSGNEATKTRARRAEPPNPARGRDTPRREPRGERAAWTPRVRRRRYRRGSGPHRGVRRAAPPPPVRPQARRPAPRAGAGTPSIGLGVDGRERILEDLRLHSPRGDRERRRGCEIRRGLPRVALIETPRALGVRRGEVGRRRRNDAQVRPALRTRDPRRLGRLVRVHVGGGLRLAEECGRREVTRLDVGRVVAVEKSVDAYLEGGVWNDAKARECRELVESREVAGIAHRDREAAPVAAKRHGVQALGDAAGHEAQDVRADLLERLGRGGGTRC